LRAGTFAAAVFRAPARVFGRLETATFRTGALDAATFAAFPAFPAAGFRVDAAARFDLPARLTGRRLSVSFPIATAGAVAEASVSAPVGAALDSARPRWRGALVAALSRIWATGGDGWRTVESTTTCLTFATLAPTLCNKRSTFSVHFR
jgi:hypothetical protein